MWRKTYCPACDKHVLVYPHTSAHSIINKSNDIEISYEITLICFECHRRLKSFNNVDTISEYDFDWE